VIVLLSPAKTLDETPLSNLKESTVPIFEKETQTLVKALQKKKKNSLKKLMHISDSLAELNVTRYTNFIEGYPNDNAKPAVFSFKGDVYQGFEADSLNKNDLKFAQKHVRILSGLYGVLKPYDYMQPYRLEMGTKLSTRKGKNLYQFWGNKITKSLNQELSSMKNPFIVNLASNEYFKSVQRKDINTNIYDIGFKEYRNDKLTFISFNAKKARGLMARYIVKNRIKSPEDLKGFNLENYSYAEENSSEHSLLFVR